MSTASDIVAMSNIFKKMFVSELSSLFAGVMGLFFLVLTGYYKHGVIHYVVNQYLDK